MKLKAKETVASSDDESGCSNDCKLWLSTGRCADMLMLPVLLQVMTIPAYHIVYCLLILLLSCHDRYATCQSTKHSKAGMSACRAGLHAEPAMPAVCLMQPAMLTELVSYAKGDIITVTMLGSAWLTIHCVGSPVQLAGPSPLGVMHPEQL